MNERKRNLLLIIGGLVLAALVGGYAARNMTPIGQPQLASDPSQQQRRPIIQIVRDQAGLPSLADTITTLCPSIAAIVPSGATEAAARGFAVSPDGWIVAATSALPSGRVEAHFGAGPAVAITERRSDPVSGLHPPQSRYQRAACDPPRRPSFPAHRRFWIRCR